MPGRAKSIRAYPFIDLFEQGNPAMVDIVLRGYLFRLGIIKQNEQFRS